MSPGCLEAIACILTKLIINQLSKHRKGIELSSTLPVESVRWVFFGIFDIAKSNIVLTDMQTHFFFFFSLQSIQEGAEGGGLCVIVSLNVFPSCL